MPKFDKPDSPNIIWGVNALEDDLTRPDDSYIQTGWTQVKPPYEYENYSMNKLYQGFAYYNQLGFPEWDSNTEYQAGKSYVQASNNQTYKCIQTHVNRNPATGGNEAYWERYARPATDSVNLTAIFEVLFPVGSTVGRPTDPGKSIVNGGLGFGTWTKVQGRSLIGEGTYTDSRGEQRAFSRGSSEGEYKHQLSVSEMPSHNHTGSTDNDSHNHSVPNGGNSEVVDADEGSEAAFTAVGLSGQTTNTDTHNHSLNINNRGGNGAHNNIHPVFVVPLWYRTA